MEPEEIIYQQLTDFLGKAQAILLAVPPDESSPEMTTDTLINILKDTRELARARMASPDELLRFGTALPFTMLPFYDGIPTDL